VSAHFKLTALFTFFTKQVILIRRSTLLILPLQEGFPVERDACFV